MFLHLLWQNRFFSLFITWTQFQLFENCLLFSTMPSCYCLSLPPSFHPLSPSWYAFALRFRYHDLKPIHEYYWQIHQCSWTACLASSALSRGRENTGTEAPGLGCRAGAEGLCPKAWDSHHPAPQPPACWAALKLAQVRCQLLPCLPPAAADHAGEGKAAKHGPSELGSETDVVLSSSLE